MLTIYWFCFAIGGVFVLLAVLSGLDGVEFGDGDFANHDLELHHDLDHGMDEDLELSESQNTTQRSRFRRRHSPLALFKSLRFWTFGLCFFGLTGLVLSHLSVRWSPLVIAIAAVGMGILCGAIVAGMVQSLRHRGSDSLVRLDDLAGLTGTVEIPFDNKTRGKVRLQVKGSMIALIAYTEEAQSFQPGDTVLVVGIEENRLWVVSSDHLKATSDSAG